MIAHHWTRVRKRIGCFPQRKMSLLAAHLAADNISAVEEQRKSGHLLHTSFGR
jgi:hypothetical protein